MQNYSIKQLRHLLLNEKDFNIVKDYFHDWLDEHHETAFKTPTKNKKLLDIIKLGVSLGHKQEIVLRGEEMREVKGINLIHGAAHLDQIGGGMTFFYFTDLDLGLMMTQSEKGTGIISRFQAIAAENNNFDFNERQN